MPGPLVSITKTLAVLPVARVRGLEAFASSHLWTPYGARGVFGGQVVAQSLMAAINTVEGKDLHSQHCYFLLPANSKEPITFTVERLRDGKSYATRLVHALQNSQTVFILMASFTAPPIEIPKEFEPKRTTNEGEDKAESNDEPGITATLRFESKFEVSNHGNSADPANPYKKPASRPFTPKFQLPFPDDIVPWDKAQNEEDQWSKFLEMAQKRGVKLSPKSDAAVQTYIKERTQSPVSIAIARQQKGEHWTSRAIWIKPRLEPGEKLDDNAMRALFGFMTDFQFIGTGAKAIGLGGSSVPRLGMMASLDHTTHYYPLPKNFDQAAPLLHVMHAVIVDVATGRGLVRGCLYTHDGVLVAATSQEGVIRADFGGGMRPRREHERNGSKL